MDTLEKDYDAKVLQWRDRLAWLEQLVAIIEVLLRSIAGQHVRKEKTMAGLSSISLLRKFTPERLH